jgi:pimeloyl-ACP methyl ester carboxylesterase
MTSKRLTFVRAIGGLLVLAAVAYLGAIVWLIANETRLVFNADPVFGGRRPAQPYEQVDTRPVDGSGPPVARAWLLPATDGAATKPWVIFLHGKDQNIAARMNILHVERLRALGVNVIAPEYRGFGGVGGVPTEAGLDEDVTYWYDYLRQQKHVEPTRIVIYGWSLGSAVAVTLAAHVNEAAVILEGAPASVVAIGQQRYPLFPVRLLIRNPFESILRVGAIHAPLLFLHSPDDVVIPIAEGRRLFEAARPPKQFVEVSGGHVHASETDPAFFPAIGTFLRAQHLLP